MGTTTDKNSPSTKLIPAGLGSLAGSSGAITIKAIQVRSGRENCFWIEPISHHGKILLSHSLFIEGADTMRAIAERILEILREIEANSTLCPFCEQTIKTIDGQLVDHPRWKGGVNCAGSGHQG
jgi:hypothetical protein